METNIWDKIQRDTKHWDSDDSIAIDGNRVRALIDVDLLPVSSFTDNGSIREFIVIEHNISIDPSECFVKNTGDDVFWFARNYRLLVQPWYKPNRKSVRIIPNQVTPVTSLSMTSITSGTNLSLGANVGFFGNVPTGGGSASYSVSNSRTYAISDASVAQRIFGGAYADGNKDESVGVIWDFRLKGPDFTSGFFSRSKWETPPAIATNTFNIGTNLIYEIDPELYAEGEDFSIVTELSVELGCAHVSTDPIGDYINKNMESKLFRTSFRSDVKRPPTPQR